MFARGRVRGIAVKVCWARSFSGEQAASKNLSAGDVFREGLAGGKRTFASWRGLLSFMPVSVEGAEAMSSTKAESRDGASVST